MPAALTHALLALAYTLVMLSTLLVLPLGLTLVQAAILAAMSVSLIFYFREAGQLEHGLKPSRGPIMAYLGATFLFGWRRDNLIQWLAPAGAAAIAAGLTFLASLA